MKKSAKNQTMIDVSKQIDRTIQIHEWNIVVPYDYSWKSYVPYHTAKA
ncbi:hypothetical protein K2Y11_16805 [bacterium]|nr:hypothetical protein [bacterium]